jgi:hypothetical protein
LWDANDIGPILRNYDPSPDGTRFAIVKAPRARAATQVIVVENWAEELKQRVPAIK